MDKSEAIVKIKEILGLTKKQINLIDVKTTDNLIIRIDSNTPSEGANVSQILEDGIVAALNDGTYILADTGESIVVSGSSIKEVIPAPAPEVTEEVVEEAPAVEEVTEETPSEVVEEVTEEVPVIEEVVETPVENDYVAELIMAVTALTERVMKLEESLGMTNQVATEMSKVIEEFSGKPAGKSIKLEKEGLVVSEKTKKYNALDEIRKIRSAN
jgi:Na+-translocating ferredoxin:NAD+ oxidoreductase RnfG subunit